MFALLLAFVPVLLFEVFALELDELMSGDVVVPLEPVLGDVWLLPALGVCVLDGELEVSIDPLLGAPCEVVLELLVEGVVA